MHHHNQKRQEGRQDLQPWQCGLRYHDAPPVALCSLPLATCQKLNCGFFSSVLKMVAVGKKEGQKEGRVEGEKDGRKKGQKEERKEGWKEGRRNR